jgi:hypothetical protein
MTLLALMVAVAAGPPPSSMPVFEGKAIRHACYEDCRRRRRWRRTVAPHRDHLEAIAACESGGRWHIDTGNSFYGGLQFTLGSWRTVGGYGYPHQASKLEQMFRAVLLSREGGWGHWPNCP